MKWIKALGLVLLLLWVSATLDRLKEMMVGPIRPGGLIRVEPDQVQEMRYQKKMESRAAKRGEVAPMWQRMMAGADYKPECKHPTKAWDWFCSRRAGLTQEIVPIDYREKSLVETKNMMSMFKGPVTQAAWTPLGPYPPNGRIADLALDSHNPETVYAAAASGGLWKSTDLGQNWVNLTDNKIPSLGVGSIALDPNNSEIIYIGLGEGTLGATYEPLGTGVYRSDDGGRSWAITPGSVNNVMQYTADLEFGPDSETLYAASLGTMVKGQLQGGGFFITRDRGQTWRQVIGERAWNVSVNPRNRQEFLVSVFKMDQARQQFTAHVLLSTDGGQTFNEAALPKSDGLIRVQMARCQTRPEMVYALTGDVRGQLGGIWKSTDGGRNWQEASISGIPIEDSREAPGQMFYNNCIAVCPTDPNLVIIGTNLRLYKSTTGASDWKSMSYWWHPNKYDLPYVHADQHSVLFGSDPRTLLVGSDGGFALSRDGGASWEERNNGLLITQIYRLANSATDENHILIGCQDNSTYVRQADGTWQRLRNFGDGMEVIIDAKDSNYVYGTNYHGVATQMSTTGGHSEKDWFFLRTYQSEHGRNNGIPDDEKGAWLAPFINDPVNPETLYLGLINIYRTTVDKGGQRTPTWEKVFGEVGGQPLTMETIRLSYGPENRKMFFFGVRAVNRQLQIGLIRANLDGSGAQMLKPPHMGIVGDMACDPNNNNNLWLSYCDVDVGSHAAPRIFKSEDLGQTFTDKTNNLPKTSPVNTVFIDPENSRTILIGTDIGVFRSDDDGGSWYAFNQGLPNVVITDMAYFPPKRKIRVATYGRGVWETALARTDGTDQGGGPDATGSPLDKLHNILKKSKKQ